MHVMTPNSYSCTGAESGFFGGQGNFTSDGSGGGWLGATTAIEQPPRRGQRRHGRRVREVHQGLRQFPDLVGPGHSQRGRSHQLRPVLTEITCTCLAGGSALSGEATLFMTAPSGCRSGCRITGGSLEPSSSRSDRPPCPGVPRSRLRVESRVEPAAAGKPVEAGPNSRIKFKDEYKDMIGKDGTAQVEAEPVQEAAARACPSLDDAVPGSPTDADVRSAGTLREGGRIASRSLVSAWCWPVARRLRGHSRAGRNPPTAPVRRSSAAPARGRDDFGLGARATFFALGDTTSSISKDPSPFRFADIREGSGIDFVHCLRHGPPEALPDGLRLRRGDVRLRRRRPARPLLRHLHRDAAGDGPDGAEPALQEPRRQHSSGT